MAQGWSEVELFNRGKRKRKAETHINSCCIKWALGTDRRPSIDGDLRVIASQHQTLPTAGNSDTNGKEKPSAACC